MKEKVITIGGIIFVVLTLAVSAGLTYSFFTASVGGNEQARETVVDLAELRLKFTDTQNIQMLDALPGQAVTKTFTVENKGDVEIEYTIDIENLTNTFVNNELVYSLTSTNGGATANRKAIPTTSGTLETATIAPGVTQTYTMTVLFKETGSNQNSNMGAIFGGVLQINSNGQYTTPPPSVANVLFDLDAAQSDAGISFGSTSEQDGTVGLYYTSDTSKTENGEVVYYYRGAVTNNYLVFGNYCWRIVRTVEDGSVRLRYGGVATKNADNYICPQIGTAVNIATDQVYNESLDNKSYVDYKTSSIKTVVEDWYRDNIAPNSALTDLIKDTSYCGDMSERINGSSVYFGAYDRLHASGNNTYNPQYKCPSSTYAYTVAKGDLNYPVALLTADEIVYAGGLYNTSNENYFLRTGKAYWTMTPTGFYGNIASVFTVGTMGGIGNTNTNVATNFGVLPVISIKEESLVKSGTGLYNDPFVINTD